MLYKIILNCKFNLFRTRTLFKYFVSFLILLFEGIFYELLLNETAARCSRINLLNIVLHFGYFLPKINLRLSTTGLLTSVVLSLTLQLVFSARTLMHTHAHTHMHILYKYIYIYIYIHVCVHVCACVCASVCVHVCVWAENTNWRVRLNTTEVRRPVVLSLTFILGRS